MALSGTETTIISTVVSVILGLFGGGSLVALLRAPQERQQIVVQSAQGVLLMQSGVLTELRAEVSELKRELREVKDENEHLQVENDRLKARVAVLEQAT